MTTPAEKLVIEILSDTTFGRGCGTAGIVNVEVDHDRYGLPQLNGKALRSLLRDSWLSMQGHFIELKMAGRRIFGPHSDLEETAILRLGDAIIDQSSRDYFVAAVERLHHPLAPATVLASLTEIRSQTSEDRMRGAPAQTALRSTRVVIRGIKLVSLLSWNGIRDTRDVQCLALTVLATRHGGLGRNRGRGHLRITIDGDLKRTADLARGVL